jgi:hypothetical protein
VDKEEDVTLESPDWSSCHINGLDVLFWFSLAHAAVCS